MHKIHTNCISISYCTTLDLIRTCCVIILRHYGVLTDCDRLTVGYYHHHHHYRLLRKKQHREQSYTKNANT